MATRFYLPATLAAAITPPAPASTWEHIQSVIRALLTTPDASALTTAAYNPDGGDDLTDKDANHRQYVSSPLSAQTLDGNVKAQFQCSEVHANNNLFLAIKILVVPNDGSSVLATLLDITRDTTTEVSTTLTNRNFPSIGLTSYMCADRDRLVIEIGLGGLPVDTSGLQNHNGSIQWGCSASSGDLPEDDSTTATTYRPWVEFSSTYTFLPVTVTPAALAAATAVVDPTVKSGTLVVPAAATAATVAVDPTVLSGDWITPAVRFARAGVVKPTVVIARVLTSLVHTWTVLTKYENPFHHTWMVLKPRFLGDFIQHEWTVKNPLTSITHRWRVLPGDLIDLFNEDIQKPVATITVTP